MKKSPVFWIVLCSAAALLTADLFFTVFSIVKIAAFYGGRAAGTRGYTVFSIIFITVNAVALTAAAGYLVFKTVKAKRE